MDVWRIRRYETSVVSNIQTANLLGVIKKLNIDLKIKERTHL